MRPPLNNSSMRDLSSFRERFRIYGLDSVACPALFFIKCSNVMVFAFSSPNPFLFCARTEIIRMLIRQKNDPRDYFFTERAVIIPVLRTLRDKVSKDASLEFTLDHLRAFNARFHLHADLKVLILFLIV